LVLTSAPAMTPRQSPSGGWWSHDTGRELHFSKIQNCRQYLRSPRKFSVTQDRCRGGREPRGRTPRERHPRQRGTESCDSYTDDQPMPPVDSRARVPRAPAEQPTSKRSKTTVTTTSGPADKASAENTSTNWRMTRGGRRSSASPRRETRGRRRRGALSSAAPGRETRFIFCAVATGGRRRTGGSARSTSSACSPF
jgi:hypothetical protein